MIVIGSIAATYEFTGDREWLDKQSRNYQLLKYIFHIDFRVFC